MLQMYQNAFYSVAVLLVILILTISNIKRLPLSQTLLWIYAAGSSLYPAFSAAYNPQEYLNPIFLSAAKVSATQSLLLVLLVPLFVLYTRKELILYLLKIFFVVEALTIIAYGKTLMMGWSSYSSTMLALSSFLFFTPGKKLSNSALWLLAVVVLASFINISVTAMLVYAVGLGIYFWNRYRYWVMSASSVALGAFIAISPVELTNGNGRYEMWADYWVAWTTQSLPKLFGTGLGTWEWIGPQIKGAKNFMGYSLIHNDFWQVLIEMGFVGFALFMWVYLEALYKNRGNKWFLIPYLGYSVAAMLYFPLHMVPCSVMFLYYFIYRDRAKI